MLPRAGTVRKWLSIAPAVVLPLVLVFSSVRTFRELDRMKVVYLRNRAAAVAARIEAGPPDAGAQTLTDSMMTDEPALVALEFFSQPSATDPPHVIDIWRGVDLFHTEFADNNGVSVFRAFVPLHRGGRMQIARVDLEPAAADFLVVHARHNVAIAAVSGLTLILFGGYVVWSVRLRARDERERLQTEHLARLGELSAVLAHEIRNPLATMKGFVQLASEAGDERTRALLRPAVAETKRIETLVSELLQYARPPSPDVRNVEWREIAAELAAGAGDTRVSIRPADLEFATDPGMIRQILQNLIRNAVDAIGTDPGGKVLVSAAAANGSVVMEVEDNGPGIPAELRDKVFEAFFTTRSFGTGLGLPTARKLAAALGGTLCLSAGGSGGVCAQLQLPAAGAAADKRTREHIWN